ncbi:hypothetical protein [uncultured Methanoregula sp.]|uniref:hypothetical protein n=1 Tax=uncultured Methanoregula sp. TaxID=1005933 RepID=UPI002AAB65F1|nr:hypothetical protein [uncultured Methanoregula sp.]
MNETFLLLLGIVSVFAIGCSIALLSLGKMIDKYPAGDESKRSRSIASPIETTKISVVLFWVLFITGSLLVLQEIRIFLIIGITMLFATCLFMFTALAFSFAVLSTMRSQRKKMEIPVFQLAPSVTPIPSLPQEQMHTAPAPVLRKRYNNPISDFMLNALLKKE